MEYLLLFVLLFSCSSSQEVPEFPVFPDYFQGAVEYNTIVKDAGYKMSNITRYYYDKSAGLARSDMSADTLNEGDLGTVISIVDPGRKVNYLIYPEYKNCTVKALDIPAGGGGIIVNPDGTYSFGDSQHIFFMVNASEYQYTGNSSAHGIDLDNWSFTGDVDLPGGLVYRNVTLGVSIARAPTPSIYGTNEEPVPWRFSIDGLIATDTYNVTISTVIRYFGLSFTQPSFDMFDVSLCLELKDYVTMIMSVPKGPNNMVDYSSFNANLRKSIVNYTGLEPIQVGNIQIVSIGRDELFTTLQLSNITSKATVKTTPMTAMAAYNKIALNTVNGQFPFQVDIGSGFMVTPKEIIVSEVDGNSTMPTPSMPTPVTSITPFPATSMVPAPPTTTTTVTVTVTPSACPSVPAQPPMSTASPCPTPVAPPSTGKTYSKSYVAGLAIGMIILGAVVALLVLFVVVFICSRFKKFSMRTGYERQVNVNE